MSPNPVTVGIKWSRHAVERWAERFPDLDRKTVFGQAVAASRKIRAKIKKQCTGHGFTFRDCALHNRNMKSRSSLVRALTKNKGGGKW